MVTTTEAYISDIICHQVCNNNTFNIISNDKLVLNDNINNKILSSILLKPFDLKNDIYDFFHDIDLELNVLRNILLKYRDNEDFVEMSKEIVRHLESVSNHPNIKDGNLIVSLIQDVVIDCTYYEAIGIFKIENKESFLELNPINTKDSVFRICSGIVSKNIDKACLAIFTKDEPSILFIDKNAKDTQYWVDDFLHVRQRKDEYANTQNFMTFAKDFVTKELPNEFEVTKADQIDLLNKSLKFFKEKDTFDIEEFANEVIEQPEVIEKFHQYKREYEEESQIAIDDQFTISESARKKQQRSYKRVIRLDQKIQIIIDGNRENVEQGEDERGKFYKVYYRQEM